MSLYTTIYAPKNSSQVFGQEQAVAALKNFIISHKQQKQKAALLLGPIGVGKTSGVYALAKELDYDLLEINSSDLRNEESMKTFLGSALGQQSLFFRPKIILVDEVDNISGREDRGCIPALVKAVQNAPFPVILTANDISDKKFKPLQKECCLIEFQKPDYKTVAHTLLWVAEQENISVEHKAVNALARRVDGDMRSALIDFQMCSLDKNFSMSDLESLSDRKRTDTILNALTIIFKSSTAENALPALEDVDMELRDVMFWIDENLPREYLDPKSLAKAYEHLARADVFQGRIRRQQHWRFLVYMGNLLTAGISSAKGERNTSPVRYQQTMRFLKMWQAKMKWAKRKEIAEKLAKATHTSRKVAFEQVPYVQVIIRKERNREKAATIARELDLSEEEVEWMGK